jgi:hypothetical protein
MTKNGPGRMAVPLGMDEADRRVRLHEMAHVRWTPVVPDLEGVSFETMNAVEDRRMHKRLHEAGLGGPLYDGELWPDDHPAWDSLYDRLHAAPGEPGHMAPLDVARLTVASDLTAESVRYRQLVQVSGQQWILALTDAIIHESGLDSRRPAWKRTIEAAKALEDAFMDPPELDEAGRRAIEQYPSSSKKPGRWGDMTIETPPLPDRLPMGQSRRRRASDVGAVPRNWSRLATDGRVFSRRQKRPGGGTVLIDQSGSMSLAPEEVMALIEAFPAVTVATYAGYGSQGYLRVIARNGRRASEHDCYLPYGGNVVDGPALDWLGEQTGPRIWVSDGYVTGTGDGCPADLVIDAARKVKAGGIRRFDKLGQLLPGGDGHA